MARNNFRKIRNFRQLTKARKSLDEEVRTQAERLWIPYAVAIVNAIRSICRKRRDDHD